MTEGHKAVPDDFINCDTRSPERSAVVKVLYETGVADTMYYNKEKDVYLSYDGSSELPITHWKYADGYPLIDSNGEEIEWLKSFEERPVEPGWYITFDPRDGVKSRDLYFTGDKWVRDPNTDLREVPKVFLWLYEPEKSFRNRKLQSFLPERNVEVDNPAENAYSLIVGPYQALNKKHALDMFKIGVAWGKSGDVILDFKEPSFRTQASFTIEDMRSAFICGKFHGQDGAGTFDNRIFNTWLDTYLDSDAYKNRK